MEQLYRITLALGLLPFAVLIVTIFLQLTWQPAWLQSANLPIILLSSLLVIVGLVVFKRFFQKAKKKKSERYLSRALLPLFFLVVSLPLIAVTYFTTHYVSTTHTVTIVNDSDKIIKRMFFSNGDEKYFVKPIEPDETFTKALIFDTPGSVTYSLTLDTIVKEGTLFRKIQPQVGSSAKLTVTRSGRVLVKEVTE